MLQTHHRSRPLSLIYDIIPYALVAVQGCPYHDKLLFCYSSLITLYPAPHLPLVATCSIAWSVCTPVMYINPNTSPKVLHTPRPHGTLFPFSVPTLNLHLRADGRCHAVQARLCRKRCRYVIGLGPCLLSMTSSPSALVAVPGFSSFHFRFAPSDKSAFCHLSLVTLYPAPLLPLDDNSSIAWSVRVPVQYI